MDLQSEYFWATECNLVTLHEVLMLSNASKKVISRQKKICARMLGVCHDAFFEMRTRMTNEAYNKYYTGASSQIPRISKIMELNNNSVFFNQSVLEQWVHIIITEWTHPKPESLSA